MRDLGRIALLTEYRPLRWLWDQYRRQVMLAYPSVLPMDCFRSVMSIIQTRAVMEKKEEFAACLWNLQGYLQGVLVGPGPSHQARFGAPTPGGFTLPADDPKCRELADALQQLQVEMSSGEASVSMATAPMALKLDLNMLMQLIPLLLQILQQLGVFSTAGQAVGSGILHPPGTTTEEAVRSTQGTSTSSASSEAGGDFGCPSGSATDNTPVTELDLDSRVIHSLEAVGIKTVADIAAQCGREGGLTAIEGIGDASEQDIHKALKKHSKNALRLAK